MGVLKDFRRATDALERIATALNGALRSTQASTLPMERLQELERSRALWEADVEGLLQKAEGKLRAAANAEARERTMKDFHEDDVDPFPPDSPEVQARLQDDDAEAVYPEEVLPLPVDVASESRKAFALRMKFS